MVETCRAEVIGSLLRPSYLMEARAAWQAGQLTLGRFKQIEDRAVDEALELQAAAGIDAVIPVVPMKVVVIASAPPFH